MINIPREAKLSKDRYFLHLSNIDGDFTEEYEIEELQCIRERITEILNGGEIKFIKLVIGRTLDVRPIYKGVSIKV